MNYEIVNEKELYNEVMLKYSVMTDEKLKRIIHILDTGKIEGLCMPEFLEFCQHLLSLDNKNNE